VVPVDYGLIKNMLVMPEEFQFLTDLIKNQNENCKLTEWGSGASTFHWICNNPTVKVTSIEHNLDWYNQVTQNISYMDTDRITLYYKSVTGIDYDHGYGHPNEENPIGLNDYFYPDDSIWDSDIYFVDGISRGVCSLVVRHMNRNPSARVFFHDYRNRVNYYCWVNQFYSKVIPIGETMVELVI
jgi:hypothetical protein